MESPMSIEPDSTNVTQNESTTKMDSITQALKNEVILEHIFAFLNSESFKCCRMVCRLWKTVGEVSFKKKYRICFNFKNYRKEAYNATHASYPEDLRSFFQNAQQEIPFHAMKLKGRLIWSQTALTEFFESEGRFITDLILDEVSLAAIGREGLRSENQKRYFKNCDFATLFRGLINLKNLKISGYTNTTTFKLTLGLLSNIQSIELENCEIELTEHTLKPVKLQLACVRFYRGSQLVQKILINDFVDLSYLKGRLYLDATPSNNLQLTKLKLDFHGTCKLNSLFLFRVEVLNLKSSSWKIESGTHFMNVLIQEKINLTTRSLNIIRGSCDLHWVPESCVDVHLDKGKLHDEILQRGFHLPNVKCLHMSDLEFTKNILPNLSSIFINLEELHLTVSTFGDVNMEITSLPQKLTKIFLSDNGWNFIGDGVKSLEILSKRCTNFESVEILLNHFTPENLLVFIKNPGATNSQTFLTKLAQKSVGKMIVGIIVDNYDTPTCTADRSPFPGAHKAGELYAFINGKGGVIIGESYMEAKQHLCNELQIERLL